MGKAGQTQSRCEVPKKITEEERVAPLSPGKKRNKSTHWTGNTKGTVPGRRGGREVAKVIVHAPQKREDPKKPGVYAHQEWERKRVGRG